MRVLMIVLNQTGRGTYWRAWGFARHLARRGHAVTLMTTAPEERIRMREREARGVRLVEAPDLLSGALRSGWDPYAALRRAQWVRARSFDLVHAFESRPVVLFPARAARARGARLVMDWGDWFGRGGSVEERPNPLVRAFLRPVETYFEERFRAAVDGTTVINTVLRDRAVGLGVPPESILVLRNGSDPEIRPMDRDEARRALPELPAHGRLIGFVGGTYAQDAALMARAFNRVREALSDARLLLVGHFNRPIEGQLEAPEAAVRTGPLDLTDVYRYLSACDLTWLPLCDTGANRGRWPYKLNDYMTVGRAVVTTRVGDLGAVVARHRLGVTAAPDPQSIAWETLALLRDPERRRRLGEAARAAAETTFSWGSLTDQLEQYYTRVLSDG